MKIIDMHAHLDFDQDDDVTASTPKGYYDFMKKWGISEGVVIVPPKFLIAGAAFALANNCMAFYRVDFTKSCLQIIKGIKEAVDNGYIGIKIHPYDFGKDTSRQIRVIAKAAQHYKIPILIHTWHQTKTEDPKDKNPKTYPLKDLIKLSKDHPELKIIAAHIRPDAPGFRKFLQRKNCYGDTAVTPVNVWKKWIKKHPKSPLLKKIFYGSDYNACSHPWFKEMSPVMNVKNIRKEFPKKIQELLFYDNAKNFLEKTFRQKWILKS